MGDLKVEANTKGLSKVKDFWDHTISIGKWRTWRNFDFKDDNPLKVKGETLMKVLEQRDILASRGHDQLRWGKKMRVPLILRKQNSYSLN